LATACPAEALKVSDLRIAIVVMAYNPYQYFAEFIEYHKNLVDQIYLVDHRSSKKISSLSIEGVTFIESNQVAQFQSEVTNAVIRDFRLYENFDWIFVLDIDEFLPFTSKRDLCAVLSKHEYDKVVAFNWRNGVGVYPTTGVGIKPGDSLIDVNPLLISDYTNINKKVAVNSRRLRYPFYFRTGAHEIVKPLILLSKFTKGNKYKTIKPALKHYFIYHILAFDRQSFHKKIQNYVDQMDMRRHVKGQAGWMVREYLLDFDDHAWLQIIQNFRISNENHILRNVDETMFSRQDMLSHLSRAEIYALKNRIQMLEPKTAQTATELEQRYLKNKLLDTDLTMNLKNFIVKTQGNEHNIEII